MSASYAGISETVIHFVIYESIKRRILEAKATQHMDEESSKDASDFVGMMLAAATSKTCATSIAYPHGEVALHPGSRSGGWGFIVRHVFVVLRLVKTCS
jgi:hypothetical protein